MVIIACRTIFNENEYNQVYVIYPANEEVGDTDEWDLI